MAITIRTFLAFDLPDSIKAHADRIQSALRERGLHVRWVKPHGLHLTLKFLGDIPEADAGQVASAVRDAVRGATALTLCAQGLGVFPGIKKPRVLWMGLGGETEKLRMLHAKIEEALEPLGFEREKRGFKAHLTLGRFKEGGGRELLQMIEELGGYAPIPFFAGRLVFYKSDLRPQGAVHTPLAEIRLDET